MRNVVTGLMMLAGAAVREKGHGFDDFGWRREVQQAREAQEADAATSGNVSGEGKGGDAARLHSSHRCLLRHCFHGK